MAGMAEATSHARPADHKLKPSAPVCEYLLEHLEGYRELSELQKRGWEDKQGDDFFQRRRQRADDADSKTKAVFYNIMRSIGHDLDRRTSALTITPPAGDGSRTPAILDLCMAPSGFSASALARNPTASLGGISLPPSEGGHDMLIPGWELGPRIEVSFRDITMLAAEMGTDLSDIPADHPEASAFSSDRPFADREFDLVLCDGQVLRTHERLAYRERREAARLLTSQLVLALQRVRDGGTLVVLLHKADAWDTVSLLHAFASFAQVGLFKPRRAHAIHSSFYLVAQKVRPGCAAAQKAVAAWKARWAAATFLGGTGAEEEEGGGRASDDEVAAVLREFGPRLVELAQPIFAIQAAALRTVPFLCGKAQAGRRGRRGSDNPALMASWRATAGGA